MRGAKGPRRGPELQELGIIHDGSLLIRNGVIEEIGPTRRIENLAAARGAIEISAIGRVVMPGFVDSHTHLVFPAPGSHLPGDCEEAATRAVHTATCQRLQGRVQVYLETMARHGTTTVEAKTGCWLDGRAETKLLRVLEALRSHPLDVVPTFLFNLPTPDSDTNANIQRAGWILRDFLPKIRRRRFARFADLLWDSNHDRQEIYSQYLETSRDLGFGIKIHAERCPPAGAISLAIRYRATSIDHLEGASDADAALLAGSGAIATLLPCVSFCASGRYAPARALIDAGAPVALATNFNPHHAPTLNMQAVVTLACLQMGLDPAEAISAATINGAHALGCADRVGSLELGKSADLVILNLSDYNEFGHHFGMNLVHMTMKHGEFIYKEGDVCTSPGSADSRMAFDDPLDVSF